MKLFVNQLGYDLTGPKRAVITAEASRSPGRLQLVDAASGTVHRTVSPDRAGPVAAWEHGTFWTVKFDEFDEPGTYVLRSDAPDGDGMVVQSRRFTIEPRLHVDELLSDLLYSLTAMRSRGAYDRADRAAEFVGEREGTVDVHGGWFDASADQSKYLSHLSYATYWNPQQIPMAVWGLLDARDRLFDADETLGERFDERLREEALHGADFLVRMHDEAGYFYMTLFDGWSHDPDQREICAFRDREGTKTADYEAGYRQGGGAAIAALARASTVDGPRDIGAEACLDHAVSGFDHLESHNESYLDDGTENVIDDYCALLAATELLAATGEPRFETAATERARALLDRQVRAAGAEYAGWWRADDATRPFFHAVEEGLPVVALLRYRQVSDALAPAIGEALKAYWSFQRRITSEVTNPFGYARQYVVTAGGDRRPSFFMPQDNETGYWWLGENSRIASLATAARHTAADLPERAGLDTAWLRRFARDQVNWILGVNPFGASMMRGVGGPIPDYDATYRGVPGGVCNGITAAVGDPAGIAFAPEPQASDLTESWRWTEQWLPHAVWLAMAIAADT